MAKVTRQVDFIRILGSYLKMQYPKLDPADANAFAEAYGKSYWGDNYVSHGEATWEDSDNGDLLKTSYTFLEDDEETLVHKVRTLSPEESKKFLEKHLAEAGKD